MYIDAPQAGHFPYYSYHLGPKRWPCWRVHFLNPAVPASVYREKAAAAARHGTIGCLALDRQRGILYSVETRAISDPGSR